MGYAVWLIALSLLKAIAVHGYHGGVLISALWLAVLLYLMGAFAIGAIIGLLEPLMTTFSGAVIVGVVAVFALALAISPIGLPGHSLPFKLAFALIVSLVAGPAYTAAVWEKPKK